VVGQLFWRSAAGDDEWVSCPLDEITWLDRSMLSGNEDLTLHRAPRCAGLRYVHHRWELFSRDTTYQVYLAPDSGQGGPGGRLPPAKEERPSAEDVQRTARYVLPVASAGYEARPVVLEKGNWLVSVAAWVLRLRLELPVVSGAGPAEPDDDREAATQAGELARLPDARRLAAVAGVRAYFERNATARLAMAYYYQQFILGLPAPQSVPMMNVVIALNLSGEGAVSDYKKLLQGIIWSERGHARDLAGFLLANGLLTPADLEQARRIATENERNGVCEMARQRLRYHPKSRQLPHLGSGCVPRASNTLGASFPDLEGVADERCAGHCGARTARASSGQARVAGSPWRGARPRRPRL
jgi:hypothetical protein